MERKSIESMHWHLDVTFERNGNQAAGPRNF